MRKPGGLSSLYGSALCEWRKSVENSRYILRIYFSRRAKYIRSGMLHEKVNHNVGELNFIAVQFVPKVCTSQTIVH